MKTKPQTTRTQLHPPQGELLTIKELACILKRSVHYIYAMRKRGYSMPGDRGTLLSALEWLEANPNPARRNLE